MVKSGEVERSMEGRGALGGGERERGMGKGRVLFCQGFDMCGGDRSSKMSQYAICG